MNSELLNRSLQRILDYALAEGAREFSIALLASERAEYHYKTAEGVIRRGTISPIILNSLGEYANELACKNVPVMLGAHSVRCALDPKREGREFVFFVEAQSNTYPTKSDSVPTSTDRCFIYLVDDNQDFSRVLDRFLARSEVQCESIGDARELMKKIRGASRLPDAIVCDLHMPHISGFEVLEKSLALGLNIPIIILTSDESIESEIAAVHRGAALVLKKSHDPRVLVAHIERMARSRSTSNLSSRYQF
jgi:CheY-like chemotaxis protein